MRDSNIGFFLVGIACGAAFGLVFAPMAGKELRETIVGEAKEGVRLSKAAVERSREARSVATDAAQLGERMQRLRRPL